MYYTHVYGGTYERVPLCRSIITAVLDIVPSMHACGPASASWQFPAERKFGELGTLIHSHSHPSANRNGAVARRIEAELVTSFGETYLPAEWAAATGKSHGVRAHPVEACSSLLARREMRWNGRSPCCPLAVRRRRLSVRS